MSAINQFLLQHNIRISNNPCISPDFCLDWPGLRARLKDNAVKERPNTRFETAAGRWVLLEDEATCDCAWKLEPREPGSGAAALEDGVAFEGGSCRVSRDMEQPASAEERGSGARSGFDDLSNRRRQSRPRYAGDWRAFHHAALARR